MMNQIILVLILHSCYVLGQMPKKPPILPLVQDIPFIQCDICQRAAKVLYKQVRTAREDKEPVKLGEDEILNIIEKVCDADSDYGKWIRNLDILESKDTIKLQEHSKMGKCREECKTISYSCEQTIGDIDTDLSEVLWQNELKLSPFINEVCHSLSSVCKKSKPKFVKGKRKDFKFNEMTEKDFEAEKVLANMKGMPGMPGMEMYSPEDLQNMREELGVNDKVISEHHDKQEKLKQQQQQQESPDQFKTQLGLLDTVKAAGKDLFKKIKSVFGYIEKSEL